MERTCERGCTAETCPPNGAYYVSCTDAGNLWLMAGPYQTHAEALAHVDHALKIADSKDGRAWFMGWGTVNVAEKYKGKLLPLGRLNELGLL